MVENKWVNGGIAVAVAGVLTGVAVWMSSGPSPEQAPRGEEPGRSRSDVGTEAAPPDAGNLPRPSGGGSETEAAPADMGGLPMPSPKG